MRYASLQGKFWPLDEVVSGLWSVMQVNLGMFDQKDKHWGKNLTPAGFSKGVEEFFNNGRSPPQSRARGRGEARWSGRGQEPSCVFDGS